MAVPSIVYGMVADGGRNPAEQIQHPLVRLTFAEGFDDLRRSLKIAVLITHEATMPERSPIGNKAAGWPLRGASRRTLCPCRCNSVGISVVRLEHRQ